MKMTSDYTADLLAPITRCMATWGQNACPNEPEYVIVNTSRAGFCPVCLPHAASFPREATRSILVSIDYFEAMRENGLYTEQGVPSDADIQYALAYEKRTLHKR